MLSGKTANAQVAATIDRLVVDLKRTHPDIFSLTTEQKRLLRKEDAIGRINTAIKKLSSRSREAALPTLHQLVLVSYRAGILKNAVELELTARLLESLVNKP